MVPGRCLLPDAAVRMPCPKHTGLHELTVVAVLCVRVCVLLVAASARVAASSVSRSVRVVEQTLAKVCPMHLRSLAHPARMLT